MLEEYQLEIKFDNIAKFCTRPVERDIVQIMMVLRKPAKVLEKTKDGFREMQSLFRLSAPDKMFMNAWNLKQVIFVEGSLEITTRLEKLIKVVQSTDMVPTISPFDLGKVRVLDNEETKCIQLHEKLMGNNERFNSLFKKMILPLRFSILALLTARKCTVFDTSLCDLMQFILDQQFEGHFLYRLKSTRPINDANESSLVEQSIMEEQFSDIDDGNQFYLSNEIYQ